MRLAVSSYNVGLLDVAFYPNVERVRRRWFSRGPLLAAHRREDSYEDAREATRRAVLLALVRKLPGADASAAEAMTVIVHTFRTITVALGAVHGLCEEQVDASVSALCDQDAIRLKGGPEEEFVQFASESHQVVRRFLATLQTHLPAEEFAALLPAVRVRSELDLRRGC